MRIIAAEWLKLKRSKLIGMTTVLTLLAVVQGYTYGRTAAGEDIFISSLYQPSIVVYAWLILPLIITVVMTMMAKLEHGSNRWKDLLALPVRRGQVYAVKLIVGIVIILYSLLLLYTGIIMSGLLLKVEPIPYGWLAERLAWLGLSSLAIIGVMFYLSYRFSHFGVPLAVGAGLILPAMLAANSETYWIYYPWDYPIVAALVFEMDGKELLMAWASAGLFVILTVAGFFRFIKKDVL